MDTFAEEAFATFHYALKENGFFFSVNPETVGVSSELFTSREE
jgi:two-component system CheB/CheR fusion protein